MTYVQLFERSTGFAPLPYQVAFHRRDRSRLEHKLIAPTGLGKTYCTLVDWIYGITHDRENTPTRLVYSLPLRTLTEQIYADVKQVVAKLNLDIGIYLMMGGSIDNHWVQDLSRPCILIGTLDQIMSRQLMRGYCSSRWSWPLHFAAFHNDCRIVVDETQLQGPAFRTSAALHKLRAEMGCYGRTEVIWMSATLDDAPIRECRLRDVPEIGITEADCNHPVAGEKITRPKRLHPLPSSDLDSLAAGILSEHQQGTLTLAVVNTVGRAISLFRRLRDSGIPLRLLHAQFRKADRTSLTAGLREFRGIVISTQVVEAGVDLDARVIFTDLCPWASFVQRVGRAGRNATYEEAICFWMDTTNEPWPYEKDELTAAREILNGLEDCSVANLLAIHPPPQNFHEGDRPDKDKLEELYDTAPNSDNRDDDIEQYIRRPEKKTVNVAWRIWEGSEPPSHWTIQERECCPVPLEKFRAFVTANEVQAWKFNYKEQAWERAQSIGPKEIILIPCSAGGYDAPMGWTGDSHDIPEPIPVVDQPDRDKDDYSSFSSTWVTLTQHSIDTAREMAELLRRIGRLLSPELQQLLMDCARWHDLGKAHPVFQETMNGDPNEIWAKSDGSGRKFHARKGFRHELASALAAIAHGKDFLFAYLLAAHHGKVRISLILPGDEVDHKPMIRGVKEGEVLPEVDLGEGVIVPAAALSFRALDPDNFLFTWREQCGTLYEEFGPFRLAYLEALVRNADAIASGRY